LIGGFFIACRNLQLFLSSLDYCELAPPIRKLCRKKPKYGCNDCGDRIAYIEQPHHFPFAFGKSTRSSRNSGGPFVRRRRTEKELKRPPVISNGLPGSKLLALKYGTVRPGVRRLALASEGRESKLLFHQRNKNAVAAGTHSYSSRASFRFPQ
jgi:uncharacterized protein YneF (UPF0154 family)